MLAKTFDNNFGPRPQQSTPPFIQNPFLPQIITQQKKKRKEKTGIQYKKRRILQVTIQELDNLGVQMAAEVSNHVVLKPMSVAVLQWLVI